MQLLARGRAADVFDLGDGTVLRRYRADVVANFAGEHSTEHEAEFMRIAARAGYPVPEVVRARAAEIVMERVSGVTMLEDLGRRPWRLYAHAATLAELMARLHQIALPTGSLLHFDLHPGKVVLSPHGPVVIDWTNARAGEPAADVAQSWLIIASSVPDGGRWQRSLVALGRGEFVRRFLSRFDMDAVRAALPDVARERLKDQNVRPAEAAVVRRIAGLR